MSGVVARRFAVPAPQGGMGVRVDPALISGHHGILLVPTFANCSPEAVESLSPEEREWLPPDALEERGIEVWSYRAQRDPWDPKFWRPTQRLHRQSSHADRYALTMIAGTGRSRADDALSTIAGTGRSRA